MNHCSEQEFCGEYSAGHKRKSHHVRITVPCTKYIDGACSLLAGQSCNLAKMRRIKGENKRTSVILQTD